MSKAQSHATCMKMNTVLLLTFILTRAFTTAKSSKATHTNAIVTATRIPQNPFVTKHSPTFLKYSPLICQEVSCKSSINLSRLSLLSMRGGATSQSSADGESTQDTNNNNTKAYLTKRDNSEMQEKEEEIKQPNPSNIDDDITAELNGSESEVVGNQDLRNDISVDEPDCDETGLFEADSTTDTDVDTEMDSDVEADSVVDDASEIIITTTAVPSEMNVTSSMPQPVSVPVSVPILSQEEIDSLREEASDLRAEGKEFHDEGDLENAATLFDRAASILSNIYSNLSSSTNDEHRNDMLDDSFMEEIAQEAATCRLHQALCALKNKEYQTCIDACSSLLLDEEDEKVITNGASSSIANTGTEPIITPLSKSTSNPPLSAAVRARAHHRRAKARLGLDNYDGALEDAKTAAFLGDRGAVALYGRLMREKGSGYGSGMEGDMMGNPSDALGSLFGNSGNSGLGENPFAQFQSLMGSSSDGTSSSSPLGGGLLSGDSPLGGLGALGPLASMLSPNISSKNDSHGSNSMVQTMVSTLTEKIQSEETQTKICSFLNSATESQISTFASMANVPLSGKQISKIVKFSNAMTVSKMQKSVNLTKRGISAVKMIRKVTKIIGKYRYLLVYLMVLQWVKSALNRPIIVKLKKK